jgi:hypothetical protein
MSFPFSGNIATVPLPDVLQNLQHAKVTGTLTIRKDTIEKCVHFKNGQIIFATSNDARDRIGEILVKAGFLTPAKLEAALALYRKNAGLKKIGAVLVENGFVVPKDLFSGLKTQVKDIIFSLFLWSEAEYRFEEQLRPDVIQLQINLQELVTEIIERIKQES